LKRNVIIFVYSALILSTLLVFWQVRNFDFVDYDDDVYVYDNPNVFSGLNVQNIKWAFTTGHAANWHPLTWLSLMLDCQIFGAKPGPMHLVNIAFHIVNTILLFAIFNRMTGKIWPSAFVAALFALHPLHIESVVWITERKDVLSTLFWLLTMLAYIRYVDKPSTGRYVIVIILFALGLMSKPMLVTLPFVLLLIDYWPLNRFSISNFQFPNLNWQSAIGNRQSVTRFPILNLLYEKVPFFALAAVSSVVTYLTQRAYGAVTDFEVHLLGDRIANAFLSYATYIGKMFWPQNLAAYYPARAVGSITLWQFVSCALLLGGVSLLVILLRRVHMYLLIGWFWFLGTLAPVIGIIQIGEEAMADRYAYIPLIGLFIMLAWGLPELLSKFPYRRFTLGISAAIVLTALGINTHRQAGFWKDGCTLFSHTIEVTHNNSFAYHNLGAAFLGLGRYQDAIEAFKQAIRIKPHYHKAIYNLGVAYAKIDRYQDAIEAYKQAIVVKPDFAEAYNNLGNAYLSLGRYQEAIDAYQQAVKIKPDLMEAHFNLGFIYSNLGRYQDAIESFKRTISISPDYARAYFGLGFVYGNLGRYQDAIESFKHAIKIKPDLMEAYFNLGVACANLGRYQDAIESFKQTIKIKPDYVDAHLKLGMVYLTIGDKVSALEEYKILKSLGAKQADQLYNSIYK
jgi:tetratricopeptide (TPR) repeat protein